MDVSFELLTCFGHVFESSVLHTVTGVGAKLQDDGCKIIYCPLNLHNIKISNTFKQIA